MPASVKFTSLNDDPYGSYQAYFLEVDDYLFLLDCGWDNRFDMKYIDLIKARADKISAILISYQDIAHIGALPYLMTKCNLTCPVYATVPVCKMGLMFLYDWLASHKSVSDFNLFELEDIDATFERIMPVKYSQIITLDVDKWLSVQALPAGHMIGGAYWKISRMGDEDIVYAVDFNNKKDTHLNKANFTNIIRPHILITDAICADQQHVRKKDRDSVMIQKSLTTLKDGGDILVNVDSAGRLLELTHLFNDIWAKDKKQFGGFALVVLTNVASTVMETASNYIEWMSERMIKEFDAGNSPFQYDNVQLCHCVDEVMDIIQPKLILVSGFDMEVGYGRELFYEFSQSPKNMIILTARSHDKTLAGKLYRIAEATDYSVNRSLEIDMKLRVHLEGKDLEAYQAKKMDSDAEEARKKAEVERRKQQLKEDEEEGQGMMEENESDQEDFLEVGNIIKCLAKEELDTRTMGGLTKMELEGAATLMDVDEEAGEEDYSDLIFPLGTRNDEGEMIRYLPLKRYDQGWDQYGEIIHAEEIIGMDPYRKTFVIQSAEEGEEEEVVVAEAQQQWPWEDVPTKCINQSTVVDVQCQVEFFDFEARTDGESLRKIIKQINPKNLIIVNGYDSAIQKLISHCKNQVGIEGQTVHVTCGKAADIPFESKGSFISLSNQLLKTIDMKQSNGHEWAWVSGRLQSKGQLHAQENEDGMEEDTENLEQKLVLCPIEDEEIERHDVIYLNEYKLSDIKQRFTEAGFVANITHDPVRGVNFLHINGMAIIFKDVSGSIRIEGEFSDEYFGIRETLYSMFAII
uniref:Cleavage and polyadenylation specificity factor subunit 2 n=1 Tax=Rhabditophanes sp. KR3021 TaxID=114890 RepID=A0AC35U3G7_9BILA